MNRLRFFLLVSLLLHLVFFGLLSRVSLRVPETAETGPLSVRLVSATGNVLQEQVGEKLEEDEETSRQREQKKDDAPKEATKPEKTRKKPETVLQDTKDKAVPEVPEEGSRKSLKPEELAETGKRREPAKGGVPEIPTQDHAADPQKTPATGAAIKDEKSLLKESGKDEVLPGIAKSGNKKKETGGIAAEGGMGGERPNRAVPPVITEDLIVEKVMPVYPLLARRRGEQGKVLLRVSLSDTGTVKTILVEESSGYDTLDKAALQAVGQWRFSPKAPPVVLVPVAFRLQ